MMIERDVWVRLGRSCYGHLSSSGRWVVLSYRMRTYRVRYRFETFDNLVRATGFDGRDDEISRLVPDHHISIGLSIGPSTDLSENHSPLQYLYIISFNTQTHLAPELTL